MRRSLNFGGFPYCLFWRETAFGVNQVRSKDGVNESWFAQASLAYVKNNVNIQSEKCYVEGETHQQQ